MSEIPDPSRLEPLKIALRELAARFVDDVLALLLTPPEVPPPPPGPRTRRPRERLAELEQAVLHVVATLGPISTPALARAVGTKASELAHPLRRLLRAGLVEKWGDRRGTRYGAPRPEAPSPRPLASAAPRPARATRAPAPPKPARPKPRAKASSPKKRPAKRRR